jgi:60 kDa SS-A/Ro ribonucleoprotein
MSNVYAQHLGRPVPQTEALPGQVANSAGGYSFPLDDWARLDRFLILGSEGGSYYASERKLTLENAAVVERCVAADGLQVVRKIREVSLGGRAPKNDPALLALAIAAKKGDIHTRQAAFEALPAIARIGTHLFHFVEYCKVVKPMKGGWGRATKRAFGDWYLSRDADKLAMQVIKYQERDGWRHRDILRLAHPKDANVERNNIFKWMTKGWGSDDSIAITPGTSLIMAFERAKTMLTKAEVPALCALIKDAGLPHECVPNEMKQFHAVWEAMLPQMGLTALIRNLGKMTSIGLLAPLSTSATFVCQRLGDLAALQSARIHPLNVLVALRTYAQGHGEKGKLSWSAVPQLVDALDGAFYSSFKAVEPTGKRHMLAIDISASMDGSRISGMPLTAREGAAAMALVTANVEPEWAAFGFCTDFRGLTISARSRLDQVINYMRALHMGGTDCALPMTWAAKNKVAVDTFVVYTDSETQSGSVHPAVALRDYRQKMGIPAKLIVVGMSSNGFTLADPKDGGTMDVVGFDSAAPAVMADFART